MSRSRGASRHPESLTELRTSSGAPQLRHDAVPGAFCSRHHWHSIRSTGGKITDELRIRGRFRGYAGPRRLAAGSAGLKLHPAYDDYPADTAALDPYLKIAAEAGVPVTVHSSPGPADPDLIARLAERFPAVPFVLYHTFLGPPEGRQRAARHAKRLTNVHLETSWCASDAVERLLDEVGPDRVLFGSDAATDGPSHFVRRPPNIEMRENYNGSLLRLAKRLKPAVTRNLLEDNARKLFGLKP
jgi:predicted TIM-barrel fold metal-dependent hydrolase